MHCLNSLHKNDGDKMCNQHRELAALEMSLQSTLTLWTTRYYGHPVSTDMG